MFYNNRCQGTRKFLSTLSLRRATGGGLLFLLSRINFYPRSPCGERLHFDNFNLHCVEISIHALLAESDVGQKRLRQKLAISIHALLAESDIRQSKEKPRQTNFYPRSPCGERRQQPDGTTSTTYFYPRSPCGERLDASSELRR